MLYGIVIGLSRGGSWWFQNCEFANKFEEEFMEPKVCFSLRDTDIARVDPALEQIEMAEEAAVRQKALKKHAMKMAVAQTVSDARAFAEHDGDGNTRLDFDEFYALQPQQVRERFGAIEIRRWFNNADEDRSGDLSLNDPHEEALG